MTRILLVEDEVAIADSLLFSLAGEGFEVQWVSLAREALAHLRTQPVDLVILDVGLPDMTGFECLKALREFSEVPAIFLTARTSEVDRVVGLEIGADDYVVKPFSPREVAARVRAILKRSQRSSPNPTTGEFRVDEERAEISYRGAALKLTPHEFGILTQLLAEPRKVFRREQLLQGLGVAADAGYERNIDGHVRSLRAKLREVNAEEEPIQTHRGFGYSYQPMTKSA
jgi:two-component system, OmpR family, catabolic regulation response regulator CreB